MSHSGYTRAPILLNMVSGINGLAIDREGRLIVDQHGNRRVGADRKKGPVTVLSDQYQGKRLNSPNDLGDKKRWVRLFYRSTLRAAEIF